MEEYRECGRKKKKGKKKRADGKLNVLWKEGHDKVTWGVAFKIPSDDAEATRAYLDHREKVNRMLYMKDVIHHLKKRMDTLLIQ